MVNRDKQLALAQENNLQSPLYVQDVRNSVKGGHTLEDEVAMLRKMCGAFLEYHVHGTPLPADVVDEFKAYYGKVEQIKKDLKEEIGLNENTDI